MRDDLGNVKNARDKNPGNDHTLVTTQSFKKSGEYEVIIRTVGPRAGHLRYFFET